MKHQLEGDARKEQLRLEYLGIKNYRALNSWELKNLTMLTGFLGPNGNDKSTVFDVFAFLLNVFPFWN